MRTSESVLRGRRRSGRRSHHEALLRHWGEVARRRVRGTETIGEAERRGRHQRAGRQHGGAEGVIQRLARRRTGRLLRQRWPLLWLLLLGLWLRLLRRRRRQRLWLRQRLRLWLLRLGRLLRLLLLRRLWLLRLGRLLRLLLRRRLGLLRLGRC